METMPMLITIFIGIVLGVFGSSLIRDRFHRKSQDRITQESQIYSFLENMISVGELVVYKAFTKEIVTTTEHWLGNVGKKYAGMLY